MNESKTPRIAFLGICDRVGKVRNIDPRLYSLNILGLRCEVISHIFPMPLRAFRLVFAAYNAGPPEDFDIICKLSSGRELVRFHLDFNPREVGEIPPDPTSLDEMLLSSSNAGLYS